ncbi:MAG: nucleoside deaminase [Microbacteriaceae bacterium]
MQDALNEARRAGERGEVPVAAILLDDSGVELARAINDREGSADPTAHAEVLAIREAAQIRGNWNLSACTLVVTLEPCLLCAATIQAARISTVVYGAWDEKAGAVGSVYDVLRDRRLPFRTEVITGVCAEESAALLSEFFEARRLEE